MFLSILEIPDILLISMLISFCNISILIFLITMDYYFRQTTCYYKKSKHTQIYKIKNNFWNCREFYSIDLFAKREGKNAIWNRDY